MPGRLLPLLLLAAACARADRPLVLGAASLSAVLPDALRGEDLRISFGPSSALARQIEQGIEADLFVSADETWVDHLLGKGLGREKREVARNVLVAWVREGSPAPAAPHDLKDPRYKRIAVGADPVPVGRYARQALEGLELDDRFLPVASAPAVLHALEAGEADVGIAYATDGLGVPGLKVAFAFERPRPSYWALVCRDRPEARRLLDRLGSPEAAAAFARHGFEPVR
jgi:molybdate transport system substrate-binding protein